MKSKYIEELFTDFILDAVGPDTEKECERENKLFVIKNIIFDVLKKKLPDFSTYVILYGSYPNKTYLKDADIDLTIIFESKLDKKFLNNIPRQIIDKTLSLIKDEFERKNKESAFELISDIKIIKAGIRLLKCKVSNISIDISINNFSGLYKILFIDFIEGQLMNKLNYLDIYKESSYSENKLNLYRRTLLLIKAWCFYEEKLMGSNMGLMASYTLEILVIYMFNFYYDEINNEFDGFKKFFEIMYNFDFERDIFSLFGIINNSDFNSKILENNINKQGESNTINKQPFWYLDISNKNLNKENSNNKNKPLLNINDVKYFIINLNNETKNLYQMDEVNIINNNFNKFINIIDPLNDHNNLGKSISFFSKSRMKIAFANMHKKLKIIEDIKNKSNPILYMNSLLNLFKMTLSQIYFEIFENFLKTPEIISDSDLYQKFYKKNNGKEKTKYPIEKSDLKKFISYFCDNKRMEDVGDEMLNFDYEEFYKSEEIDIQNLEINKSQDEEKEEEEKEENKDEKAEKKIQIKNKIIFDKLINKDLMKKLFSLIENKQKNVKFNNMLITKSKEYSFDLKAFLKEHNLNI